MMMSDEDTWFCANCEGMNSHGVECCTKCDTQRCQTANGAIALPSTDSCNLDFFAGGCRGISEESTRELVRKAAASDMRLALQNVAYCRDSRGGRGERQITRWALHELSTHSVYSQHVKVNMARFIDFGRWDDIVAYVGTLLEGHAVTFVAAQFKTDLQALQESKTSDKPPTISLLAKWFPSEGRSLDKKTGLHGKVSRCLGITAAELRKTYMSPLRAAIGLLETKMSRGEWDSIDFSQLPSLALKIHASPKGAFVRRCPDAFAKFKEDLAAGKTKANTKQLFAHQIVESYYTRKVTSSDPLLEYQWKQQVERVKEMGELDKCVTVCDVSGSMTCANGVPMLVSLAMGIVTADAQRAPWGGSVITFSETPEWHTVTGATLYEKVTSLRHAKWGMSTNLQAVFDLVLQKATCAKLPQAHMPTMILIISDMQFDQACRSNTSSNLAVIKAKFSRAGYECPRLVFWNVNGSTKNVPAKKDDDAVSLISGFSVDMLGAVMGQERLTPEETMRRALAVERYACLSLAEEVGAAAAE
jgi:hypothetical protein